MTCKEFQDYWETDLRVADLGSDPGELIEHVTGCPECDRFVEEQNELRKYLHVVRDSVPATSVSLDGAVIASYRHYMSERLSSAVSIPLRLHISSRAALGWAAAVAFAVVVAYGGMLLFVPRQHGWPYRRVTAVQPTVSQAPLTVGKEMTRPPRLARKAPKPRGASIKSKNQPISVAEQNNSLPTRFQSLMYCDQISCPSAMDVIRVQLPSPVLGLTPASALMTGFVSADVLVGPDGIARGIRVVE